MRAEKWKLSLISGGAEKTITLFIFYFFKNYQSYGSYIWYTS